MHDPRTSPALRTLAEMTGDPPPPQWNWSIGRLDPQGRVSLGPPVVAALGPGPYAYRWHHLVLVVEADPDLMAGRAVSLDSRGRLLVPAWLRDRRRELLIGLSGDAPRLLVASADVLDRLGDVLTGGTR